MIAVQPDLDPDIKGNNLRFVVILSVKGITIPDWACQGKILVEFSPFSRAKVETRAAPGPMQVGEA